MSGRGRQHEAELRVIPHTNFAPTMIKAPQQPKADQSSQSEMDTFFDFNQGTNSPSAGMASKPNTMHKMDWGGVFDGPDERPRFNGPSHNYGQYKQQVGVPAGSTTSMPLATDFSGYGTGLGDMDASGGMAGWSSGIDLDAEMTMDFGNPPPPMPSTFFPAPHNVDASRRFVDPNTIEESASNVGRLWPGMHQQAAMQRAAQAQAMQQRQARLHKQQAQYRQVVEASSQPPKQAAGKPTTEPHVEESISRLLHRMRHNNHMSNGEDGSPGSGFPPNFARLKKDEEEMDEDERLLASEEGKKLTSKERRQLRNKVSARAFRSRRKGMHGTCASFFHSVR